MTISNDQNLNFLRWEFHDFGSLDTTVLFALLKLRVDVFVVEQACAYPELDSADTDSQTIHLLGFAGDELAAYARAMPGSTPSSVHGSTTSKSERLKPRPIHIGRVVIARAHRGKGLATTLMQKLMLHLQAQYPGRSLRLAAQESVQGFYASLGFAPVSGAYLEDGISHVDMERHSSPSQDSISGL